MATRIITEDEDDEVRRERKSKVQALESKEEERQKDCIKIVKALIKIPWLFQQEVPRWQVEEFLEMRMKKKWPASFPLKVDVFDFHLYSEKEEKQADAKRARRAAARGREETREATLQTNPLYFVFIRKLLPSVYICIYISMP